jgi:hypothetical protein
MVTVGGDDALTTVAIVITTAPTALTLFFFVMVNRIVPGLTDRFNLEPPPLALGLQPFGL